MAEVYQGKYVRDNHLEGHCIHGTLKILYSDLLVAAFSSQIYYILLYYYYTKHLIHFIFQSKLFHVYVGDFRLFSHYANKIKK